MIEIPTVERLVNAADHLEGREWRQIVLRYHYRRLRALAEYTNAPVSRSSITTVSNIWKVIKTPKIECDGCGGVSNASGLRWGKADRGEAVTISVNHKNKPASLHYLTDELILERWFKPWSDVCDIKFKLVSRGGDCRIGFKPLAGSTLGMVLQPRGAEFMEQGGELSGDMWIDSDRVWTKRMERGTGCHEGGHVIGLGHINSRAALLNPFLTGHTVPQRLDIEAALISYPYERIAA